MAVSGMNCLLRNRYTKDPTLPTNNGGLSLNDRLEKVRWMIVTIMASADSETKKIEDIDQQYHNNIFSLTALHVCEREYIIMILLINIFNFFRFTIC